jgi:DNA repair photolyase
VKNVVNAEKKDTIAVDKLAKRILSNNLSKSIPIKSLLAEYKKELILDAISQLERKAKVYVERHPEIIDGALRKSYEPTDIVYFGIFPSITRRTLLYKTAVEYGDYTINHILGCSHGCEYPCYAMQLSKRYGRISSRDDWLHPRIVSNALQLLEKEIPKYKDEMNFVHLSFMTDPFMYDPINNRNIPWIQKLTLRIIERLNKSDIKATVLTKSRYPIDLVDNRFSQDNEYGITLVSMNKKFHNEYEPFSISPTKRLIGLERLHDLGLKTWVSIEPYPTPNIVKQDLGKLLNRIEFVDKLIFGKWNYNPEVNGYEDSKNFYTQCADEVIDFCKNNGISLHIKEHTPRSRNASEQLFVKA